MALTPIGRRTLDGFVQKYGALEGRKRFEEAMRNGTIDRGKMENLLVADDKTTKGPIEEGTPAELAAVQQAVAGHQIAGVDDVTSRTPPQPNPTRPTTRRVPTGLGGIRSSTPSSSTTARSARGSYQKRPG